MTVRPLVAIPVRSFNDAMSRLAPALSDAQRARLAIALAGRTASRVRDAGADVVIVAGSAEVADWASRVGLAAVSQPAEPPGLDAAARLGVETAQRNGRRAYVLHADLAWIVAADLRPAFAAPGVVIAPSHDGGTALLGGIGPGFAFSYGPGSFHRHLAAAPRASVVTRPGLALDLDRPVDLELATSSWRGAWLQQYTSAVSG
jgi:2-phospho-L-lactate guanylyltransferase